MPYVKKGDTGRENAIVTLEGGMEMADPDHYLRRNMVQVDEEQSGQKCPKLALQLTHKELQLTLDIRGKPVKFLADSGATY